MGSTYSMPLLNQWPRVARTLVLISALALAGCIEKPAPAEQVDSERSTDSEAAKAHEKLWNPLTLLHAMGKVVLPPVYEALVVSANDLVRDANGFCRAPDSAGLATLQTQWLQVSTLWANSSALLLEPVLEDNLDLELNDKAKASIIVNELLTTTVPARLDVEFIDLTASSRAKGLYAIEFLLFDANRLNPVAPLDDNDATLALFTTDTARVRRCEYLQALTTHLQQKLTNIHQRWQPDGGDFSGDIANAGTTGKIYDSTWQGIEDLVNKFVQSTEQLKNTALAIPLGSKSHGVAKPFSVTHWRSQSSLAHAKALLKGLTKVYRGLDATGANEYGFDDQLEVVGQEALAVAIDAQLEKVRVALDAIDGSLYQAVGQKSAEVEAALQATTVLTGLVKRDMSNALGVSIGFTSNDGD